MLHLSPEDLKHSFDWPTLIDQIQEVFGLNTQVPPRHHHRVGRDTTLLLMPAWGASGYGGVKMAAVVPDNAERGLDTVQGLYVLFDADSARPLATCDARELTLWRTAAASALASRFLSRPDTRTMLMVGAGALSESLIRAHASVRPLEQVLIWNRNPDRAHRLASRLAVASFKVDVATELDLAAAESDLISCATMSTVPLVVSAAVRNGTHVDLVGAYRPEMRESDSALIARARLFVDSRDNALTEAGDLVIPFREGFAGPDDVEADFGIMCTAGWTFKRGTDDVTVFKSVGHAAEDLAAAALAYRRRTT